MEYLKADGFDESMIGVAAIWRDGTRVDVLVYDADIMVDLLMKRDGMTMEEAYEYVTYNVEGAYMGEMTPVYVWKQKLEDLYD
jgi:hypothetical protein